MTGPAPEQWTYGGIAEVTGGGKRAVWYDAARVRWLFPPQRGAHLVVGGVYQVHVTRTESAGKLVPHRHGSPAFTGDRNPDADWCAQLEAEALARNRVRAAAVIERRLARDGGELDKLIAPIERVAASMSYPQRAALLELISRKVYRAQKSGGRRI